MKVAFIPKVQVDPSNSERTPKLLYMLSQWFEVEAIPTGSLDRMVYDQAGNRFFRYLLFSLNEAVLFWTTLRVGKRSKVSAVFGEGTYYSLAGGMAARVLGVPMVWDNHGNIRDFSKALGKSGFFMYGNLALERVLAQLSDKVLVVSQKEIDAYRALGFDTSKFMVVPTCADMALARSRTIPREQARRTLNIPDDEKVILFFGALKYMPNRDAASYLIQEMWPEVARAVPEAKLYIAGSGRLDIEVPKGVTMLGFVPDLYLWMSAADVCVAPIWKGVGILTKVIDMLSAGRATVVSPLALDGMPELQHGRNCMVGGDRSTFAGMVVELLRDPTVSQTIGNEGRRMVSTNYNWEVTGDRLRAAIAALAPTDNYKNAMLPKD
ncbi:MAG: glycosyltransferase [Candidatus Saccharibacteria bacterium]